MGVHDAGTHPYLEAERAMLVAAVDAGFEAFSSPGAAADPVLRELDGPQLTLHRDIWELPPGADAAAGKRAIS